ncbi:MAG: DUF6547 family protein [Candidatus Thorarchaeota archaeon]
MENISKPKKYREFIDCMVDDCHNGQGQIGSNRVKKGVWNINATKDFLPDQYEVNELLKRLNQKDKEIIARLLEESFEGGVFETLKYLEEFEIEPFIEGYEGSPYNDFIGRLSKKDKWEWPK